MTDDQYLELIGFLGGKFDAIDVRFERLEGRFEGLEVRFEGLEGRFEGFEGRLTRVEVGQESLRSEVRQVAEGVVAVGQRLDRVEASLRDEIRRVEGTLSVEIRGVARRLDRTDARVSRLEGFHRDELDQG